MDPQAEGRELGRGQAKRIPFSPKIHQSHRLESHPRNELGTLTGMVQTRTPRTSGPILVGRVVESFQVLRVPSPGFFGVPEGRNGILPTSVSLPSGPKKLIHALRWAAQN